jgi:glycosyltransferase involved in cell wall biosynthesis
MPQSDQPLNTNPPLVSVIIPVYNTAAYIGEALASVFAQSFKDLEVIVVNDGSPDRERLELALSPYMSRIVYLDQENRGPSAARNLAILRAQGDLLAFLDSDDTWLPEYLSEQIKFLQANPSLDMVYCDELLVGFRDPSIKTFMQVCPSTGPVTFESILLERTQVATSATLVRRQNVIAAGLFDERFRCAEDHDLWLRIAHRGGKVAYHRKALVRRLVRSDSLGSPAGSLIAGEIEVLKKLRQQLALTPEASSLLSEKLRQAEALYCTLQGKTSLLAGNWLEAYTLFSKANRSSSSWKLRIVLASLRIAPRMTVRASRIFYRQRRV